ncbi:hypothetical protein [Parapedobacter luteus]|uniref:hypothetical protein n=1 Tax=Parapedobacter luteus TaxID=623280 RepID=UPI0011174AD4|nr:hypothetical protein [Parapedobacter luteus]
MIYSILYRYLSVSKGKHSGLIRRPEGRGRYWPPVAAACRDWPLLPYTSLTPSLPFAYLRGKQRVKNR